MKKHTLLILACIYGAAVYAQQNKPLAPIAMSCKTDAGTQVVASGNVNLVFTNGSFVNNGTFTDASGTLLVKGTVNQSGTGTTSLNNITINAGGTANINGSIKVVGAISNAGTFTANGSVDYAALGNQDIIAVNYGTLKVSGSGNKNLLGNTNVLTNLSLGGAAKLITGTNLLTAKGTSATISSTAFGTAATSWIVTGNGGTGSTNTGLGGLVVENIGTSGRTGAITFPVGPTTALYNPVQLTNAGTMDNFTVNVNDQPVPGAMSAYSVKSTWNIAEAVAGGTNASISTQWVVSQENGGFVRSNAAVVHSNGTVINYKGGTGAATGSGPYTLSGTGFTSFSPFGVTSDAMVLPIHFVDFTAQNKTGSVLLQWQIADNKTGTSFIVEHSTDGKNYTGIATLYSNSSSVYTATDKQPANGMNYYRVLQTDIDGTKQYSATKQVFITTNNTSMLVLSNPVRNGALQIQSATSTIVSLFTNDGKLISKKQLVAGVNNIDVSNFAKGIYIMKSAIQTQKIVIK